MNSCNGFIIRKLENEKEYIEKFYPLVVNENWNPLRSYFALYYKNYPSCFYVGLLNDEIISIISVVEYENKNAFVGCYITLKKYRGQGYGII